MIPVDSPLAPAAVAPAPLRPAPRAMARRCLEKAALRMRQSVTGFETAAAHTTDADLAARLLSLAASRQQAYRSLLELSTALALPLSELTDIAGRLHRAWIRQLEEVADGGILDECVRGETALARALQGVPHHCLPADLAAFLTDLHGEVAATIDRLASARPLHDPPLLRGTG